MASEVYIHVLSVLILRCKKASGHKVINDGAMFILMHVQKTDNYRVICQFIDVPIFMIAKAVIGA